jgi:formiminotetrahydrofolate cyclodeaminase
MTVTKSNNRQDVTQSQFVLDIVEGRIIPELKSLCVQDEAVFSEVIEYRTQRDAANNDSEKRRFRALANDKLSAATEILFSIARLAFEALDHGVATYNIGFRPAMGDAGAAMSAAIAAITTCVFVINVNVRASRAAWAHDAKRRCDELQARLQVAQGQILDLLLRSQVASENALLPGLVTP